VFDYPLKKWYKPQKMGFLNLSSSKLEF